MGKIRKECLGTCRGILEKQSEKRKSELIDFKGLTKVIQLVKGRTEI
jgi:hypothetical protein